MKKLQNNYTTPEQSKRLLELGVPADSADMYYCCMKHERFDIPRVIWESYSKSSDLHPYVFNYLPCWSVGRLIEIYEICFGGYFNSRYFGHTLMEDVLLKIEEQIDSMNFSKLEVE